MKRFDFIDQLKGISIFLIIYGHNDSDSLFAEILTTVRLPLFFVISGFLSKDKAWISLTELINKLNRRLIIPYFLISGFLYLFWLLIEDPYFYYDHPHYNAVKNFIGLFYAQGGKDYMAWGIPMWYLPALFSISIIDFFSSRLPFWYRLIPALLLPVLGTLLFKWLGYHLPWSFDNAMVVYLFYFFGTMLRRINFNELIKGKEFLIFVLVLPIFLVGAYHNKPINYYYASFQIMPLMFLNGLTGVVGLWALFSKIPALKPFIWVGKNTLPILAFHTLAMSFMQFVMLYVFNQHLSFTPGWSFLYSVVQILLLVPVILFLNRYMPIIVGQKKEC